MTTKRILFGEWLPDMPDNAGSESLSLDASHNVYSSSTGYAPFPKASPISIPMPDDQDITGMTTARYNEDIFTITGTRFNIYKGNNLLSRVSDDIKPIGKDGGYKVPKTGWQFMPFGNSVLATNGADKIQTMNIICSGKFGDI